jgi:hypothetical protein
MTSIIVCFLSFLAKAGLNRTHCLRSTVRDHRLWNMKGNFISSRIHRSLTLSPSQGSMNSATGNSCWS